MNLSEYSKFDALALGRLVNTGEVNARELVELAISAIERTNPQLNFMVEMLFDHALGVVEGGVTSGPFAGVPFLLKDIGAAFSGQKQNMGSRLLQDGFTSTITTSLMEKFQRAGLVVIGRTTVPEFGSTCTTESVLSGPTRNPWSLDHMVGGSSGGSCAAVAAGVTPIAHANDGGGSIRVPAHCTGVFGLKPSRGRISWAPASGGLGLDYEHVVTRSVRDSAAMLDAAAGPDAGGLFQAPPFAGAWLDEVSKAPGRLKIAFSTTAPSGELFDPECVRAVETMAKQCEALGHVVEEVSPDIAWEPTRDIFKDYMAMVVAGSVEALSAALGVKPDLDKIEYSNRLLVEYARTLPIARATTILRHFNYVTRTLAAFLQAFDVYLTPTCAKPPLRIGTINANDSGTSLDDWIDLNLSFTPVAFLFNISGQPAFSAPLQVSDQGLPIGLHFAAALGREDLLFRLAGQLEQSYGWSGRTPSFGVFNA